jgi:hypothetical protein
MTWVLCIHRIDWSDEQTLVWERENAALAKPKSKSTMTLPEYTADDAARFDHLQSMFDDRAYQRDNYTKARGGVSIINAEHPRLPGMTRNLVFCIWQVVATYAIMIFRQLLSGCVIADAVGLGKTWRALGYLRHTGSFCDREPYIRQRCGRTVVQYIRLWLLRRCHQPKSKPSSTSSTMRTRQEWL